MEVCCTLGMLNDEQAGQLKDAGLTAYNHNLDTSREYYPKIITTRSYDERLETISKVREAGISVCSGGIIGLGETDTDRVGMLHTLSTMPAHPESVPVNALLAVEGTPLEKQEPVKVWDMVRMIATARIVMPKTMIRLSAGRVRFTEPEQALCFMAGANSIFTGDKLLTTPNNKFNADQQMFDTLGKSLPLFSLSALPFFFFFCDDSNDFVEGLQKGEHMDKPTDSFIFFFLHILNRIGAQGCQLQGRPRCRLARQREEGVLRTRPPPRISGTPRLFLFSLSIYYTTLRFSPQQWTLFFSSLPSLSPFRMQIK